VFVYAEAMRWTVVDENAPQGALFAEDDVVDRHVGTGEYRGLEFLHVNAKSIINEVPAASHLPFHWTVNAYRGCSHSCVYCQVPETPVLMADGRHRPLGELRPGDRIYGTQRHGSYRRYVETEVLAHWRTTKPAFRIVLEDGTTLIASGDHRFLSERGWKFVTGRGCGEGQRPHLTTNNHLLGTGHFEEQPKFDEDYRRGYLSGMVRGDGHIHHRPYRRPNGQRWTSHQFRLALADGEALERTRQFLAVEGLLLEPFVFQAATGTRREIRAIRTQSAAGVAIVERCIAVPRSPTLSWRKGFLAGVFDAEGSCSRGILRIFNGDRELIDFTTSSLAQLGFRWAMETAPGTNFPIQVVRLLGGQRERLRFFHLTDPAITRKRNLVGTVIKNDTPLRVASVQPLGLELPMCDITTGTGDFIANGVVSHNCFARPTHEYLGLNIGPDFDSKLVVKVNAVERLRAELKAKRWAGDHIAMGTNTDPYQRAEGKYRLTQGIIKVLTEARNPFSILTKSTLILRDLDLLQQANEVTDVRINLSIGTLDEATWKATEPGTPHPRQRVEAVRRLVDAGIETGVLVAPIIPGMSDGREQLEQVVRACVDAGAASVSAIPLFLRPGVREHWMDWLRAERPDLVRSYERRYARGGRLAKDEQEKISAIVRRVVTEAGGLRPAPATKPTTAIDTADGDLRRIAAEQRLGPGRRPPPTPAPATEQLTLL
jgi:DNA repair photolyase